MFQDGGQIFFAGAAAGDGRKEFLEDSAGRSGIDGEVEVGRQDDGGEFLADHVQDRRVAISRTAVDCVRETSFRLRCIERRAPGVAPVKPADLLQNGPRLMFSQPGDGRRIQTPKIERGIVPGFFLNNKGLDTGFEILLNGHSQCRNLGEHQGFPQIVGNHLADLVAPLEKEPEIGRTPVR